MPLLPVASPTPPPSPMRASGGIGLKDRLIDSHGRTITDVRISLTDRCNFRCLYCMDPDTPVAPTDPALTPERIGALCRVLRRLHVRTVRLTGGEPTLRSDLEGVIAAVADAGIPDVAMTTNGHLATRRRLAAWRRAGLSRVTISLDAVDDDVFTRLSRSGSTPARLIGHIAFAGAIFPDTKVNAVVVRGLNESQVVPLAELARDLGIAVRFIEFMPLDASRTWDRDRCVPAEEIIRRVAEAHALVPIGREDPRATAEEYVFADGAPGSIGVIAPVTRPFCGECGRLRITAEGRVRPCLFSTREWDLMPLLRGAVDEQKVADFLMDATWTKQASHGISSEAFVQPTRSMSAIGG